MNRIYKVIWSKAKQCKVVVSEITKSCSSSCRVRKLRCLPLLLSAMISFSGFYYSVNASGWGGSESFSYSPDSIINDSIIHSSSSSLSSSQLNAIKNGLFLGSNIDTYSYSYSEGVDSNNTHRIDYYLVYDSSSKKYNVISVNVKSSGGFYKSYSGYQVQSVVSPDTATSLGLTIPDSSGNIVQDQDVVNNKTLTVKGSTTLSDTTVSNLTTDSSTTKKQTVNGDSTVTGNESVTGKSTVGSLEVTGNAETKGNQTVDGTTTLNDKTTITKGGLDVTGGTITDSLTVTGDSNFTGNTTVNGSSEVKGDSTVDGSSTVKGNQTVDGTITLNDKTTITKGGLDVTGGTTTDSL